MPMTSAPGDLGRFGGYGAYEPSNAFNMRFKAKWR